MRGRIRAITGHTTAWLAEGWEFAPCAPDTVTEPGGLAALDGAWLPTSVPCTAASALRARDRWSLDGPTRRFDAEDWWFRTTFAAAAPAPGEQLVLRLDGLATLADVWLNGRPVLSSESMFRSYEVALEDRLLASNVLAIRFRSLDHALAARRPRPRWRTPMVEHQQLRWFRTSLLGRTPGWSPPAAAVGPWRGIAIERRRGILARDLVLDADGDGAVRAEFHCTPLDGRPVGDAELVLTRAGKEYRVPLRPDGDGRFSGRGAFGDAERWWPHTHGAPALYEARIVLHRDAGEVEIDAGRLGFRTIAVDRAERGFRLRVNGVAVFCRGACWTPLDPVSLDSAPHALERALDQVAEGGMNMVRVGGTMVYESDAFLDGCDSRGILLWQDLMFANMDYPLDAPFVALVAEEVRQVTASLRGRACLAVLCGNSEGEQQAAMWGSLREHWPHPLFHEHVAAAVRASLPSVAYWPSSTHGGDFPHQASGGTASYYGVGAYLRPLEDARRAEVRFATECLAFANIPEDSSLERIRGGLAVRVHHGAWRERAPRDLGAGWDFDDVRDHYLRLLFGEEPLALRYSDHDRYIELGRVVTGEVMAATFLEWRRHRSPTAGALVWFLRDLWHGAGWGVVDAAGRPKAAWHYLRRALAPVALGITDEGGNGLSVHLINDRGEALRGVLEVSLVRAGEILVGRGEQAVEVAPRGAHEMNALALFEGFRDLGHAYRFGPPQQEVVIATLRDRSGAFLARAVHFVGRHPAKREHDIGLAAELRGTDGGTPELVVRSRRFAQSVHVEIAGLEPPDDYFHLGPGEERVLAMRRAIDAPANPSGLVRALNAEVFAKVRAP